MANRLENEINRAFRFQRRLRGAGAFLSPLIQQALGLLDNDDVDLRDQAVNALERGNIRAIKTWCIPPETNQNYVPIDWDTYQLVLPRQTKTPKDAAEYLAMRGVADAASAMGVETCRVHGRDGLRFLVRDAGGSRYRFRNITSDGPKTYWLEGDYTPKYFYHTGRILEAIQQDDGRLYIASGEFDLLTFHAAGAYNVIAFASENSVPANFADVLQNIGVSRVEYWPDVDTAGLLSGRKVQDAATSAGIACNVYDLSPYVDKRGDTNDLWQAAKFDANWFWRSLRNCPLTTLPVINRNRKFTADNFSVDESLEPVRRAIAASLLREPKAKRNRDEIICCSPFRQDRNPSFSWNVELGTGIDFGTGEGYSTKQLADYYNIDI
jgi:hypothetical protein